MLCDFFVVKIIQYGITRSKASVAIVMAIENIPTSANRIINRETLANGTTV
jgi:hypothetical protein